MKTIQTNLSTDHLELIKIFFEANELPNVRIYAYDKQMGMFSHRMIEVSYDDQDGETGEKITYMSMVHAGFCNMLDDFLMKCGVDVWKLAPKTIKEQELKEKEEERDRKMQEQFQQWSNNRTKSATVDVTAKT
jgi:hypothetical protein